MIKKILYYLFIFTVFFQININISFSNEEERKADYSELRDINIWTFNEFWYRITEQYLKLKQEYEVNWKFDPALLNSIKELAQKWYSYLPDNLDNKNFLSKLETALRNWENNSNDITSMEIAEALRKYLYESVINKISWTIETNPSLWNAPLNVTLRSKVIDPSWTIIPDDNYIWWIDKEWKKEIIWKWVSLNYTFVNEWNFSIFLDVISSHRNKTWYIDVLPFRWRSDIEVKQEVANLVININWVNLWNKDSLKFNSEEWSFWLIVDASSSTPTRWSRFIETSWDFWNWITKKYDWSPKIERVTYATKWEFKVKLKLKTNELEEVEREFYVSISNPIATINASQDSWCIWDRLNFSAKSSAYDKNSIYNWEIININNNKTVFEKTWNFITYEFKEKWKFNIKLKVTNPSWEVDNDNKIIYINSRAPVAEFSYSIPKSNEPNKVLLDATKSYDEDYSDDWKLQFFWEIDWKSVKLENSNYNNSLWYYTFNSEWEHIINLEVMDPDWIKSFKKNRLTINSVLSVDFEASPLVINRQWTINFTAKTNNWKYFNWNFWDWISKWSESNVISHKFDKSWTFNVKLETSDKVWNTTSISKKVHVWESKDPYALIDISYENWHNITYNENWCWGKWSYILDRIWNIKFSWQRSVNIDWENSWLDYSWKIWNELVSSNNLIVKKFDEIWCFPVKLIIKSQKNWKTSNYETNIEIKNIAPELTNIEINPVDLNSDPVIVNLKAMGAKDKDWVILSYTWYYYTNNDEEPQDYRVTVKPETTFVLPKIPWTYYFVVVLKDNNEEKFSSEDLWTKSSITITWDNSNTPIVDLEVNDSSVSVWEEVIFTSKIKNILWQDLTNKASYYWDFNWDWFYDKEINWNWTISHKFDNAWTYRVKVKAKYKWFSNVKTVTINVVNNLVPDFEYISINNKFIFFDKSLWKYNDITWDLWDWSIIDWVKSFIHKYSDPKDSHEVILKISEWSKYKEIKKIVTKNIQNLILANNKWLNIFSIPKLSENWKILLENQNDRVIVYMWDSRDDNIYRYAIDFDIEYDSDLNWWKDDDIDNIWNLSYTNWDPQEITLNNQRNQIIRLSLIDKDGKVIDKKDIEIIKEYISEQKEIKELSFSWVTNQDKQKIEELKSYISKFPQTYRVEWMKYLERLQSEWFDPTEKTKVILEFEWFIDNPNIPNSNEIINLLESLLVTWEEEQNQKNVAYNALKNLLTEQITCEFDINNFNNCKEYLVSILDSIKISWNENFKKEQAKILLQAIANEKNMSVKEKEDFKEVLKILVYDTETIVKQTEDNKQIEEKSTFFSKVLWILFKMMYIIMFLILLIWLIILFFWLFYKFTSKDPNKKFEDFILEKTKIRKKTETNDTNNNVEDILWWLNSDLQSTETNQTSWETQNETIETNQEETNLQENEKPQEIPDWLKDSFKQNENNITEPDKNEISDDTKLDSTNQEKTPDWLKDSFSQNNNISSDIYEEGLDKKEWEIFDSEDSQVKIKETWEESFNESKDQNIDIEKEPEVPDWLKDSLNSENKETQETKENDEKNTNLEANNDETKLSSEINNESKENISLDEEEVDVPDWLKDSLPWAEEIPNISEIDKNEIEKDLKSSNIEDTNQKINEVKISKWNNLENNVPQIIKEKNDEKDIPKTNEIKTKDPKLKRKESTQSEQKKFSYTESKKIQEKNNELEDKKEIKTSPKKSIKPKSTDKNKQKNWNELWQDGMNIPDWLQDDKGDKK